MLYKKRANLSCGHVLNIKYNRAGGQVLKQTSRGALGSASSTTLGLFCGGNETEGSVIFSFFFDGALSSILSSGKMQLRRERKTSMCLTSRKDPGYYSYCFKEQYSPSLPSSGGLCFAHANKVYRFLPPKG